ncbi:MAG: DUF2339 domain-containing protein [Rhizobiales bacterium]|nr:DUF2339 domain-containing protein [Hyphomicrobiales bacterium]MBI3674021.1 DUF2339 domain-containing protein [Hyphomicrobiales bacterium]
MDGIWILLLLVIGLLMVATPIAAFVALSRANTLRNQVNGLRMEVDSLSANQARASREARLAGRPIEAAAAAPFFGVETPLPEPEIIMPREAEEEPVPVEQAVPSISLPEPEAEPVVAELRVAAPTRDMEQAIASRWFVWIGGAAIAIGGLLFVKYAYDNHLISPTLQIILGLLAGGALVAGGEFLRRRGLDRAGPADYVPAALSAAGLVTAFGSIYAAYALYDLIGPTVAFTGLALVALGALALSRVEGPLIAALGLIGSYGTPAMVQTNHPQALTLFGYLLVIMFACFATLRRRNWWWLGFAAVAGGTGWALLWINGRFTPADVMIVGLFTIALTLAALFGLMGRRILDPESGSLINPTPQLAIGLAGLAAGGAILLDMVAVSNHGSLALVFFFGLAALAVALAWLKPGIAPVALVSLVASFAALMLWSDVALHQWAMDERGLWTSLLGPEASRFLRDMLAVGAAFTLVGSLGARSNRVPLIWGLAGGVGDILFVASAWSRVDGLLSPYIWALIAAIFAAVLLTATAAGRRRHDEAEPNLASGFLSAGAALLLLFALFRLTEDVWLSLAIAVLASVFAGLAVAWRVTLHGSISAALGSLVTLRLFLSRLPWLEKRDLPWGEHWPVYGYGVPAVLFILGARLLHRAGQVRSAVTLEGLSLGLVMSLVALELRVLITGGYTYDQPQFTEMAAHILTWYAAAYGLMYRQRLYSAVIARWGARLLIGVASTASVLLSVLVLNPVATGAPVPGGVALNALLLAYLAPVVLIGLIARRLDVLGWERLRGAAGGLSLLLAFVYLTMETKRVFQGAIIEPGSLSSGESYAYSAVWLLFALGLFVAGLKLARQPLRYAGLGVMVLVVLKVFLWDMASLEGLYRIASFVGLGLCLVGIGWLYQHFVQKPGTAAALK